MNIESIAKICHEVNKAYCESIGDNTQVPWDAAQEWQRESAIKGVMFHIANPDASPSSSHESWLEEKRRSGWKYGPRKDESLKEHPCFVPYDELPTEQRSKDYLFKQVVHSLSPYITTKTKLSLEDVEAVVENETYQVHDRLTICVLLLKNGFRVVGKSACASDIHFDEKLGRALARKDAIHKAWELEGYLLRSKLSGG